MAQIPAELLTAWREHPHQAVRIIVRVEGNLLDRQQDLQALGAVVVHTIRLTNSLTVACDGRTALTIAQLPWVLGLSSDARVSALGRELHG